MSQMSPRGTYQTPDEVQQAIRDIKQHLEDQDKTYSERRREDDERERIAREERHELMKRVDNHGKRTTVLETNEKAFFGPQGAYRHIVAKTDDNGKKLDKLFYALLALALAIAGSFAKAALHL